MQFIDLKSRHKLIGDKINARIQKVMDHGQFILGPEAREVECKLAQYTGSKHCVTVSSGTDALLIACNGIGSGAGDRGYHCSLHLDINCRSHCTSRCQACICRHSRIHGIWIRLCLRQP